MTQVETLWMVKQATLVPTALRAGRRSFGGAWTPNYEKQLGERILEGQSAYRLNKRPWIMYDLSGDPNKGETLHLPVDAEREARYSENQPRQKSMPDYRRNQLLLALGLGGVGVGSAAALKAKHDNTFSTNLRRNLTKQSTLMDVHATFPQAKLVGSRGRARHYGRPEPEESDYDYLVPSSFNDDDYSKLKELASAHGMEIIQRPDGMTAHGRNTDISIYPREKLKQIHASWKLQEAGMSKQDAWSQINSNAKKASEQYFLVKQALIADNVGSFIGNHGGGRWGGIAAGVGASMIPGVMTVDSLESAGKNIANMGAAAGGGHWGEAAWQGAKGLANAGIGAVSLVPGGGLAAKGLGAIGRGIKGLAGFGGRVAGGAAGLSLRGAGLATAGKALASGGGRWAEGAAGGLGGGATRLAGRVAGTAPGRFLNHTGRQFGVNVGMQAPEAYGAIKNHFAPGPENVSQASEGYEGILDSIPGMLRNNTFNGIQSSMGLN